MKKIELVKRWEFQLLLVCSALLGASALWVALWRPPKLIEGDFLAREDRATVDEWLARQTKSSVAEDRARAMVALGRIGDPRSLDTLLAALKDEIPRVRAAAAFAVGLLEDEDYLATIGQKPAPRAVEALLDTLADRERAVVANSVEALGKMGDPEVAGRITRTPAPLAITAVALARLRAKDAVPWLAQLLRSDDQQVRFAAAAALNELHVELNLKPNEDITRSFVNLTRDVNGPTRAAATRGLGRAEPASSVLAALVRMLADRDSKVRIEALRSLGELRQPAAFQAMVSALGNANENVRAAAVAAMGRLGNREALAVLQPLRFQPSITAFEAELAVASLARNDREYFEGFGAEIPEAYRSARGIQAVARALADIGSPRAVERLEALLRSPESFVRPVRDNLLRALAAAPGVSRQTYLDEALGDPDPRLRVAALELFPAPPFESAARLFREARHDGDPALRARALDAAARSSDPAAKSLFLEALEDENRRVRTRAVKHLREIFGEDHFEKIGPLETGRSEADYQSLARSRKAPLRMETTAGTFDLSLDYRAAPLTADRFYGLAENGELDGLEFGTVAPNAEAWFGAFSAQRRGDSIEFMCPEINQYPFLRGSLGFAPSWDGSGGGAFFISLTTQPLRNTLFTNFGRLTSGDDILDRITPGTKILRLRPLR